MTDRMATAMERLRARMHAYAGTEIAYRRGAESVTLTATLGSKLLSRTGEDGAVIVERTDMDFLIAADDLADFGEPRRGDQVVLSQGDETFVYTVLPYGFDPCWRWADQHHVTMRVHTKLTD